MYVTIMYCDMHISTLYVRSLLMIYFQSEDLQKETNLETNGLRRFVGPLPKTNSRTAYNKTLFMNISMAVEHVNLCHRFNWNTNQSN